MSLALEHLPSLCRGPRSIPCITTTTNRGKRMFFSILCSTPVYLKKVLPKSFIKVLLLTLDLSLVLISVVASHWLQRNSFTVWYCSYSKWSFIVSVDLQALHSASPWATHVLGQLRLCPAHL